MDVKCIVREISADFSRKIKSSYDGVCAVSCHNIVAYSKLTYKNQSIPSYCLYVADLNVPYEPHEIIEIFDEITHIVFSSNGKQLLVSTSTGIVYVFINSGSLHNWENTHKWNWEGEKILCLNFFQQSTQPRIQMGEVKVNTSYVEKFNCIPYEPTLKTNGKCPSNGIFMIVASGLVVVCMLSPSGDFIVEASTPLCTPRDSFDKATVSYLPSGEVCVASWRSNLVETWFIKLSLPTPSLSCLDNSNESPSFNINVKRGYSFCPYPSSKKDDEKITIIVNEMQFANCDDPNSLIISLEVKQLEVIDIKSESNGQSTDKEIVNYQSYLQKYQLIEKSKKVSSILFDPEKQDVSVKYKEWTFESEWTPSSKITCISSARLHLSGTQIPNLLAAATEGGFIYTLNKDKLQQVYKCSLHSIKTDDKQSPKKLLRESTQIVSMSTTWTGLHVLTLDSNANMCLTSLLRQSDLGNQWHVYLVFLLEYALVNDHDWIDITMSMIPNSAIKMCERIGETFFQHPQNMVQQLLTRFLTIKNSILRLTSINHQKSIEANLICQLSAVVKLFRNIRPVTIDSVTGDSDIFCHLQSFVENRNSFEILDIDRALDQMLFSRNILDYQIDPRMAPDIHSALFYATDLALYLLILHVQNSKYELIKEPKILLYLREMFLSARLWYRHKQLVVPLVLKKSDIDVWAKLYMLLTKISFIAPNDLEGALIDEIITLETQVAYKEMQLFVAPRGILGFIASSTAAQPCFPVHFSYNQLDTNSSNSSVCPRALEGSLPLSILFDHLRYKYIGNKQQVLQCTRCFSIRNGTIKPGLSSWNNLWSHGCVCGGFWAPVTKANSARPA